MSCLEVAYLAKHVRITCRVHSFVRYEFCEFVVYSFRSTEFAQRFGKEPRDLAEWEVQGLGEFDPDL